MKRRDFSKKTRLVHLAAVLLVMLGPVVAVHGQFGQKPTDPLIDWPTKTDPELPVTQYLKSFDERLGGLWFAALNQTDGRTRLEAAEAIASAAEQGMTGLEMMVPRLTDMLGDAKEHDLTRLAAAKALIALDAKDQAAALWKASGPASRDMLLLSDPVLARWQYEPAIKAWRERLADDSESLAVRISAAKAIGLAKDTSGASALVKVAMDQTQKPVLRLAAAKTYGSSMTYEQGINGVSLPARAGFVDKLVVAHLLQAHRGQAAHQPLVKLAGDVEPAIAAVAGAHLLEIAPQQLDAILDKFTLSGDVKLRMIALERMAQRKDAKLAKPLAEFLNDIDPTVRRTARDRLIALSREDGLREPIVRVLLEAVNNQSAKVQEQAVLAAGVIDIKQAAPRLVELISSDDATVALSAAASLRKLQVESTLEPALAYVKQNVSVDTPRDRHDVSAQLIQLMGIMKYMPARETFMKLVPKNSGPSAPRSAAVWALGKMHEGQPDKTLISQLIRRANDGMGMNPEDQNVREQAVIALGRMKDKGTLRSFQKWIDNEEDTSLAIVSRWAVGQTTGTRPPEPAPVAANVTGWFIEPLNR